MAKLTKLPELAIISGFKGTIDFYVWKGQPCARRWPRSPGHNRAPAVQEGWPAFSYAASNWVNLPQEIKQLYNDMATGTKKTGKDLFIQSFMAPVWELSAQ